MIIVKGNALTWGGWSGANAVGAALGRAALGRAARSLAPNGSFTRCLAVKVTSLPREFEL